MQKVFFAASICSERHMPWRNPRMASMDASRGRPRLSYQVSASDTAVHAVPFLSSRVESQDDGQPVKGGDGMDWILDG